MLLYYYLGESRETRQAMKTLDRNRPGAMVSQAKNSGEMTPHYKLIEIRPAPVEGV